MVTQHSFKTRVRARMVKTGESYTAARRMLIAAGDAPEPQPATWTRPVAEERLLEATGRGWDAWLDHLDGVGARAWRHAAIARRLTDTDGVDAWWAQTITVGYERARQGRQIGQHADGFGVSASKTIARAALVVSAAITDPARRAGWLPRAELHQRTVTAGKVARYDWEDGATRVTFTLTPKSDAATTVTVEHARLPDTDTADAMKAFWRAAMADLKAFLETPDGDASA